LALDLGRTGAHVVAASRQPGKLASRLQSALDENLALYGENVDITDESSLFALRDRLIEKHGHIDGVVFNAVSRPMTSSAAIPSGTTQSKSPTPAAPTVYLSLNTSPACGS